MDLARIVQFEAPTTVPRLSTSLILAAGENEGFKRFLLEKPANPTLLSGKRFALLSTDGVEELEVTVPYRYLQERGASVHLVAPRYERLPTKYGVQYPAMRGTHILTVRFMENSGWFKIDKFLDDVTTRDYDVLAARGTPIPCVSIRRPSRSSPRCTTTQVTHDGDLSRTCSAHQYRPAERKNRYRDLEYPA